MWSSPLARGDLPAPDRRRPPLWLDRRPEGADAAEALWTLSVALHDRRLGPDVTGHGTAPRPWISGAILREAALVLHRRPHHRLRATMPPATRPG